MLRTRLATAAVGIPILVGLLYLGGWWFTVAAAIILMLAAFEYARASGVERVSPETALMVLWTGALVAVAPEGDLWRARFLAGAMLSLALVLVVRGQWWPRRREADYLVRSWGAAAGALIYLGWIGGYLTLLKDLPEGRDWFFFLLGVTFTTDTGAYAVGRLLGKHPMAPEISPKKTWEGTAAAWPSGLVAAIVLWAIFDLPGLDFVDAVALGLILPIAAVVGDLFESLLKRGMHIKDSSGLVPGHGGFLDRLDSVLFVGAVLYFYVKWVLM